MGKALHKQQTETREGVLVYASFAPNGTSTIDQDSITPGCGIESVTWSATGIYTIVFRKAYAEFVGPVGAPAVMLNAVADTFAQWGAFTPAADGEPASIVLNVITAGVAANIAAHANNRIGFCLAFRHSGVAR
jgi:hypothetical protein